MLTALPTHPMRPRRGDRRVGFFTSTFISIGPDPTSSETSEIGPDGAQRNCGSLPCMALDPTIAAVSRRLSSTSGKQRLFDSWDRRHRIIHRRRLLEPVIFYIG